MTIIGTTKGQNLAFRLWLMTYVTEIPTSECLLCCRLCVSRCSLEMWLRPCSCSFLVLTYGLSVAQLHTNSFKQFPYCRSQLWHDNLPTTATLLRSFWLFLCTVVWL